MNLQNIKPFLLYNFKSESELLKEVEVISKNFTTNRERIEDYLNSSKMVSAYACFYLLTNIPRLKASLKLLNLEIDHFKRYDVFDIGAGPGTFSTALLKEDDSIVIRAIETSEFMVKQGKKIVKGLFPQSDFDYLSVGIFPMKKKPRLGIFGHSANEMGVDVVLNYINRLELDEVIFIEPGTKEFYQTFLKIRERLKSNFHTNFPCPNLGECPLNGDDWCHQYLKVNQDAEVERITQLAKKDRRNNPISLSYFIRSSELIENFISGQGRIVRVYPPTKFSLEWQICSVDDVNKVFDLQILAKTLPKKIFKDLKEASAGQLIRFEIEKELENNKVRGKLIYE